MNVRQKLLGGYLLVALLVAATATVAWHANAASAEKTRPRPVTAGRDPAPPPAAASRR